MTSFPRSTRTAGNAPRRRALLLTLTTTALTALSVGPMTAAQAAPAPVDNPSNPNATSCVVNGSNLDCTVTYLATGAEQSFIPPSDVSSVTVRAVGASGGRFHSYDVPGRGAVVTGSLAVVGGTTYFVEVGTSATGSAGGFNGGGNGPISAGGGGATDLRTAPRSQADSLTSRTVVAGGGGGGDSSSGTPGHGGDAGLVGSDGTNDTAGAGTGASQTAGGSIGGILGQGGDGTSSAGGGGGLYGGGGGTDASDVGYHSGGGGSSLLPAGGAVVVNDNGLPPQLDLTYTRPITGLALDGSTTAAAGSPVAYTTSYTDGIHRVATGAGQQLSISPNGGHTGAACTTSGCSATRTGTYTVTSTLGSYTGVTQLAVTAGPPASLTVSPGFSSVTSGTPVTYTTTGADEFGNPTTVPSGTTFSYQNASAATVPCDGATCTPTDTGAYTVTATNGNATGTASLAVDQRATQSQLSVQDTVFGTAPSASASVTGPSGSSPSGSVQFALDGQTVGSAASVANDGTVPVPGLGALASGSHTLTMTYAGGGGFAPSTDKARFIVTRLTTTSSVQVGGSTYGTAPTATALLGGSYPSGAAVTFSRDNGPAGDPVAVSSAGSAVVPTGLLSGLHAGLHMLRMSYAGDDGHSASTDVASFLVTKATTSTTVASSADGLTATVTGNDPSGVVDFYVGGTVVGSGTLDQDGRATWTGSTDRSSDTVVAAAYQGDTDHEASSSSTARVNPTIFATSSAVRWSRGPVTVTFHCSAGSAAVLSCPDPIEVTDEGVTQPAVETIIAADGGIATVTPPVVRIDRTAPTVQVTGPQSGGAYNGQAPTPTCQGDDAVSGLASCTVTTTGTFKRVVTTAVATDLAGNSTTTSVAYRVRDLWVENAVGSGATWQVKAGSSALIHAVHNGRLSVVRPSGTHGTGKAAGQIANTQQWVVRATAGRKGSVRTYVLRFPDGTRRVVRIVAS